jgi:hypothetical protein
MLKNFICLIFLCCLFACKEREEKVAEDLSVAKNDTFEIVYDSHLQLPKGIYLDTITNYNKESDGRETIIRPRLKEKEFCKVDKILIDEIERRLRSDTTAQSNDTLKEVFHWTQTTEPVSIYKTNKIISYGFIVTSSDAHSMRPFRKYISINFDIGKNKIIHLEDYFNIVTKSDTTLLSNMIYSAVGENDDIHNPGWRNYGYNNSFNFTIDESNVYFYFDQFTIGSNPTGLEGSIKKKYIKNLIKNEYR